MVTPITPDAYKQTIPNHLRDLIPKRLSQTDKSQSLYVHQNQLAVNYIGAEADLSENQPIATIRTDSAIPKELAIYYFEIKIVEGGLDGYVTVGLMRKESSVNTFPGKSRSEYGYNSFEGSLSHNGNFRQYGPTYDEGDVVGVCLNRVTSSLFFTKNGIRLALASNNVNKLINLYPAIGIRSPQCCVSINLGSESFLFDIDDYVMSEQQQFAKSILSAPWAPSNQAFGMFGCVDPSRNQLNTRQTIRNKARQAFATNFVKCNEIKRIVHGYILHHGYVKTAATFENELGITSDAVDTYASDTNLNCDLILRREIRNYVLNGHPGAAITIIRTRYPSVFRNNRMLFFELCLRNFIESVLGFEQAITDFDYIDETLGIDGRDPLRVPIAYEDVVFDEEMDVDDESDSSDVSSDNNAMEGEEEQTALDQEPLDLAMSSTARQFDIGTGQELFEENVSEVTGGQQNGWDQTTNQPTDGGQAAEDTDSDDDDMDEDEGMSNDELVKSLMLANKIFKATFKLFFGPDLQAIHNKLMSVFSIIAYENIKDLTILKSIVGPHNRSGLAIRVNNAILGVFERAQKPAVEQLIGHLHFLTNTVSVRSDNITGLINSDLWL